MTSHLPSVIRHIYGPILVAGGIVCAAAGAVKPETLPGTLAATGGVLAGASLVMEHRRDSEKKTREAAKVATVFQYCYAKNKGIIQVEELAFFSEIDLELAKGFVSQLAAKSNAVELNVEKGIAYSFPHPESTVDILTNNVQQWAVSQTDSLKRENEQLKAAFAAMQQQQLQAAIRTQAPPTRAPLQQEEETDPWKKLL